MDHTYQNLLALPRKQAIVEMVNKQGIVTVNDLCEYFSVSPATIRSDLRELSENGFLERTHGGAVSRQKSMFELNTQQKKDQSIAEKRAIAAVAVKQISNGDTIILDTGTTTFELAKLLGRFTNLTVVTTDLPICMWLEVNTDVNVIVIGGPVRHNFHCTSGITALSTINEMRFDKAFLAVNGVSIENGLSTPSLDSAAMKKALIKQSKHSFLLVDSKKLGHDSFSTFAKITEVEMLITDTGAQDAFVRRAQEMGVDVSIASFEAMAQ